MNNNRLILLIATIFPLLVNLPRVMFLLSGKNDENINSVMEVTVEDTLLRVILLFGFSYLVLTFNLVWINSIAEKYKVWAAAAINILILLVWVLIFHLINQFVYNIYASVIHPRVNSVAYVFFLIMLLLVSKAIHLLNRSRLDAIEKGILKQKNLQNELEALKSQINPHFLFNSLNTLSLLVREDQKAAGKFINKLAYLYRYILQSQDKELGSVKEELKVLESYVHLIEQRYQDNYKVHINVNAQLLQKRIPILALQLLMENAVKHNEISANKPLYVEIYDEGNWIVMQNILQKRTGHIESTNTGLKNLNTRTKLQMNQEIKILKSKTHFTVKVPTI